MRFIYALNDRDKELLMAQGFTYITEVAMDSGKAYVFENKQTKYATFSSEDRKKFLVTDKLHFV